MLLHKLPKDVVGDPRHEAIVERLNRDAELLWEQGTHRVPTLSPTPELIDELKAAFGRKLAIQGLEQISWDLDREKHGLDALAEKTTGSAPGARISRLLLVANDGAERFYRECESLLFRHGDRLLVCRVDATGDELGLAVFGVPKLLRALLITDKKAASRVLLTLA